MHYEFRKDNYFYQKDWTLRRNRVREIRAVFCPSCRGGNTRQAHSLAVDNLDEVTSADGTKPIWRPVRAMSVLG